MESEWKKFRAMVPGLRERYLAGCNARIATMLADPGKTETERFWDTLKEMRTKGQTFGMPTFCMPRIP